MQDELSAIETCKLYQNHQYEYARKKEVAKYNKALGRPISFLTFFAIILSFCITFCSVMYYFFPNFFTN